MINAAIQDINVALKYRQHQPVLYPPLDAVWAAEVDLNHILRIMDVVAMGGSVRSVWLQDCARAASQFAKGDHSILYSTANLVSSRTVPLSSTKYISRMFYIPHAARDIVGMMTRHASFCQLIVQPGSSSSRRGGASAVPVFKIMAYPKDTEAMVCDGLERHALHLQHPGADPGTAALTGLEIDPTRMPFDLTRSSSNFSHLICCVYSKFEGLYRWGIVSKDFARQHCLMFEHLFEARVADELASAPGAEGRPGSTVPSSSSSAIAKTVLLSPLCRAYAKLAEVVEVHFARWGWDQAFARALAQGGGVVGVDVGASPGGWTQFMLEVGCHRVVAIDPGLLAPELLATYPGERLVHVAHPVQAPETQLVVETLGSSGGSFLVACDMNMDPETGIHLVGEHVLRHLFDACRAEGRSSASRCVYLVFTLKLHKHPKPDYIERMTRSVGDYLVTNGYLAREGGCHSVHCLHTNANSINERTAVCPLPL